MVSEAPSSELENCEEDQEEAAGQPEQVEEDTRSPESAPVPVSSSQPGQENALVETEEESCEENPEGAEGSPQTPLDDSSDTDEEAACEGEAEQVSPSAVVSQDNSLNQATIDSDADRAVSPDPAANSEEQAAGENEEECAEEQPGPRADDDSSAGQQQTDAPNPVL